MANFAVFNNDPSDDDNNHELVRAELTSIYGEMRTRQRKAIMEAGMMRSDPFFSLEEHGNDIDDPRRCFAISAIVDEDVPKCAWSPAYYELQARLKRLPGMRFVQNTDEAGHEENSTNSIVGQLHWTLMQLVGFADYGTHFDANGDTADRSPFVSTEYLDCIQDSLMVGGMDCSVTITFVGVVVVSTGLLMVGVPSLDMNAARDTVRARLHERDLLLLEPFLNDIVHSTLFRVVDHTLRVGDDSDVPLHEHLVRLAKDYEHVELGTVTLNRFQTGPASWRMLRSELADTPPSRRWRLPDVHAQQEDALRGVRRSCHTVSGASGANLAREIKMRLAGMTNHNRDRRTTSLGDDEHNGGDDDRPPPMKLSTVLFQGEWM